MWFIYSRQSEKREIVYGWQCWIKLRDVWRHFIFICVTKNAIFRSTKLCHMFTTFSFEYSSFPTKNLRKRIRNVLHGCYIIEQSLYCALEISSYMRFFLGKHGNIFMAYSLFICNAMTARLFDANTIPVRSHIFVVKYFGLHWKWYNIIFRVNEIIFVDV